MSEVSFVRDTGFAGFASSARLSLDSHAFADLNTGETISIYLKPGIYHFSVIPSLAHLAGGVTPRELEIEVKPNRRFVIRVGFDGGGMIFVPLTY